MANQTIKPGDVVQSSVTGGQKMVVSQVGSAFQVRCIWSAEGRYHSETFQQETLIKVEADLGEVLGLRSAAEGENPDSATG